MKKPRLTPTRVGATTLLLAFVGLKLGGQLDWSWWWVVSPYWIASPFVTASVWRRFRSWQSQRTRVHAAAHESDFDRRARVVREADELLLRSKDEVRRNRRNRKFIRRFRKRRAMKEPKLRKTGISKAGALMVVLLGLKLSDQLDWTWWWVLSPYWAWATLLVTVSLFQLFWSSKRLRTRIYRPATSMWSPNIGVGDGLFLLFFVLKWTGHLSWSWFWVLSPLWIFKPLGLLGPTAPKRTRRHRQIVSTLLTGTVALTGVTLVALRLDGHISSWWWTIAVFSFHCSLVPALRRRIEAVLSGRLRREKEERKARRNRDATEAEPRHGLSATGVT